MPQLVSKLLSARKRPRDFKSQDYSSRVCSLLGAATGMFHLTRMSATGTHTATANIAITADVLRHTTAAQQEVCQLLQASLQQQQQQQDGAAASTQQLAQLAAHLLAWGVEALIMWRADADRTPSNVAASTAAQLHAVELAAVLAQSLQPGSPPSHYRAVASVAHRIYQWQLIRAGQPATQTIQRDVVGTPASLQLSLALLLAHSCALQMQRVERAGSSDSSSSSSSQPTIIAVTCNNGQADIVDKWEHVSHATHHLWQAAGFNPEALPGFAIEAGFEMLALLSSRSKQVYDPLQPDAAYTGHVQGFMVAARAAGTSLAYLITDSDDDV